MAKGDTVSESLRKAIIDSGETLYRVAKDSGVSYPTVHRFVRHQRPISLEAVDRLCTYLGLRLSPMNTKKGKHQ
jgi:plasmid maintenance system antidote protein VapI